jgi:hypothetical protein
MGSVQQRSAQLFRWALPAVIGTAYLWITFDPHYKSFLMDEALFLHALQEGGLTFFPGYLGFLATARALSLVLAPEVAMQFLASLMGAASVVVFYAWMRRLELPLALAMAGTLVFATGVYQLYYSSVGVTYTVESLAFLTTGYLCDPSHATKRSLRMAGLVLALCGAIRPSLLLFLLPVFLFSCWRLKDVVPLLLLSCGTLVWVVPTLEFYGGVGGLFTAGNKQVSGAVLPSTLAAGATAAAVNALRFGIYTAYGTHVLFLLALSSYRKYELLLILPGALFLALVYVAWPGYCLGVFSIIVLMAVTTVSRLRRGPALAILSLAALVNGAQFYVARPIANSRNKFEAAVGVYALQYSKDGIREHYQRRLKDVLVGTDF